MRIIITSTIRHTARLALILLLLCLLGMGGLYGWIVTGPRTVPTFVSMRIENFVTNLSPDYDVTIGPTVLKWQGWKNALSVTVNNTRITAHAGRRVIAEIPEILVNFDLWRLARGHVIPRRLTLPNPTFYLPTKQEDTPFDFWKNYPAPIEHLTAALSPSNFSQYPRRPFIITVDNLTLKRTGTETATASWKLPHLEARLTPTPQQTQLEASILWGDDDASPAIHAQLLIAGQGATATLDFTGLSPVLAASFFPEHGWLQQSTLALTGNAALDFLPTGILKQGSVTITSAAGNLVQPALFPTMLNLKQGEAAITLGNNAESITLESARLDFGNPVITGSGTFTRDAASGYWGTDAKATVEALQIAELGNYWPIPAAPFVREWLVQHLLGGTVPSATGTFVIKPEYLIEKSLPPEAIAAEVQFTGAKLHYHHRFPTVEDADGTARFTGRSMEITVNKARSNDAVLTDTALVAIPYFNAGENILEVRGQASSPASALLDYASPHEKPSPMLVYLQQFLGGKAMSTFDISVPLVHDLTLDKMQLDVRTKVTDAVLPNLADRFSLAGGVLQAKFDGKNFTLEGDGKINNQPSHITLSKAIAPVAGGLRYQVKTTLSSDELPEFGIPKPDILSGPLSVTIDVVQQESEHRIAIHTDLTQAKLTLPMTGWVKEKGEASTLEVMSISKAEIFSKTPGFRFAAGDVAAEGKIMLTGKDSTLDRLQVDKMRFGKTNATAELRFLPAGKHLILKGDTIDLSDADFTNITDASSEPGKEQFILDGNIQFVLFKNGEGLHNVKVNVKCEPAYCQEAGLSGTTTSEKPLSFSLRQTEQDGFMSVQTADAGALVRMLDISEHIHKGTLGIDGKVTRKDGKLHDIKGQMTMRDFTAVKTPLLAKLLSLGSFSGILDRLNGKGIAFKKGNANFTYTPGALYLEKAQTSGPSIGLTAEGNVDIRKERLDLTGTIVPAYAVNALFGKIPVFGQILTGGSGQGVIAAKYRLNGTYKDAQVALNPLSILTPGFLRGLFDIIDAPARSAPKAPTPESEEMPEKRNG